LWEDGWRERYYTSKFQVELSNVEFRKKYHNYRHTLNSQGCSRLR
jgi:hypothetical protein